MQQHPAEKEKWALTDAVQEARRFIKRAESLGRCLGEPHTSARAAAIRASMDLTKALAAFRKSRKWEQAA